MLLQGAVAFSVTSQMRCFWNAGMAFPASRTRLGAATPSTPLLDTVLRSSLSRHATTAASNCHQLVGSRDRADQQGGECPPNRCHLAPQGCGPGKEIGSSVLSAVKRYLRLIVLG